MTVDLRDCVNTWRDIALTLDHFGLALALGSVLPPEDLRGEALARAEQWLFTGDLDAARMALKEQGLDAVPENGPTNRVELVATALAAAAGDDRSYTQILSLGALNDWLPGYLLGVVAQARGDQQVADQAWLDIGGRLQIFTRFTFPRWAAAAVSQRSNGPDQDTELCRISHQAALLPHRLADDPQPAVEALQGLLDRGDPAGARLLRRSLTAGHPDTALPEVPRPAMTWRERWTEVRLGHPDCPRKRQLTTIPDEWVPALSGAIAVIVGLALTEGLGDWRIPAALLTLCASMPILVFSGRKIQIWQHGRRLARSQEAQRRDAELCRCARAKIFVDEIAQTYSYHHLKPAPEQPQAAITALTSHGFTGRLFACPETKMLWLGVDLASGGPSMVLRGTIPSPENPVTPPDIGMYL